MATFAVDVDIVVACGGYSIEFAAHIGLPQLPSISAGKTHDSVSFLIPLTLVSLQIDFNVFGNCCEVGPEYGPVL